VWRWITSFAFVSTLGSPKCAFTPPAFHSSPPLPLSPLFVWPLVLSPTERTAVSQLWPSAVQTKAHLFFIKLEHTQDVNSVPETVITLPNLQDVVSRYDHTVKPHRHGCMWRGGIVTVTSTKWSSARRNTPSPQVYQKTFVIATVVCGHITEHPGIQCWSLISSCVTPWTILVRGE